MSPLSHDYIYFLRGMSGVIPTPYDLKEANYSLPKYLEVGVINQPPLDHMEETILKVSEKEEKAFF